MKVTHFKDPVTGQVFREIRESYKNYKSLEELKKAYEERGKKTWLTFDFSLSTDYALTVAL